MSRRKWTITTHVTGTKREVELVVYDTLAIMRREAARWAKAAGFSKPNFSDAQGVCHGFELIRVHGDGTETPHPHAVTVRLARGNVTPTIVSHELAHAAQHLYLLDHLTRGGSELASDHFDGGNENFAHLYGEIFAAAWGALTEANLIDQPREAA